MIVHYFKCDECGITVEDVNTKSVHKCPNCGKDMYWDLQGIGPGHGDYNFVSESLAIHPDQIPAHRKLFPDVDVHADGKLEFHSVRSRERYGKRTGFEKVPQRIKTKGTRIA